MSTRLSPSLCKHNLKVLFADLDVMLAPVHVVFVNWEHTSLNVAQVLSLCLTPEVVDNGLSDLSI